MIAWAREGDAEAFSALFERHREAARRLARQLARAPSDADDLVAEAFERVLRQLRAGKGPDESFRAYLLTTLRHVHFRRHRVERVTIPTGEAAVFDQPLDEPDQVLAAFDNAAVARAFAALPERWQAILWHLEVEGDRPAQVAALLGMKPNSVSALAYRAREGLRQAYLHQHVAEGPGQSHAAVLEQLPALVRGKLGRREAQRVARHLAGCAACTAAHAEVVRVNGTLSAVVAPAVLGACAGPYLADAPARALSLLQHPWELLQHWVNDAPVRLAMVHKTVVSSGLVLASGVVAGGAWLVWPEASRPDPAGPATSTVVATPDSRPPVEVVRGTELTAEQRRNPTNSPSPTPTPRPAPTTAPARAGSPSLTPVRTRPSPAPSQPAPAPPEETPAAETPGPAPAPLDASFVVVRHGLAVSVRADASGGVGRYAFDWRFGDGRTARGAEAWHRYAAGGSYTIVLTVTDPTGSRVMTRSVSVAAPNQAPTVAFTVAVRGGRMFGDASGSWDPDGRLMSYRWDFGDGTAAQGRQVSRDYAVTGRYRVRLTVTDDRGASTTDVATICVRWPARWTVFRARGSGVGPVREH